MAHPLQKYFPWSSRRARVVMPVLGRLYLMLAGTMALPLGVSLFDGYAGTAAFVWAMLGAGGVGLLLWLPFFPVPEEEVSRRDGFAVATLAWLGGGTLGALPFVLGGYLSPVDAFFESMSGLTTTGATVIEDVEVLPAAILLWRAQIQWMGGLGIVVLAVAVLPFLGVAGYKYFAAESPALEGERLRPRIEQTARMLWVVYVTVSGAEILLLLAGGMTPLDAVAHTFTTIATGGYSTQNTSIGAYDSLYIDMVVVAFMALSGIPFALHYRAFRKPGMYLARAQVRLYVVLIAAGTAAVSLNIWLTDTYGGVGESLRYGVFQVVSIMTTTGYGTADFEQWPDLSRFVLFVLMFVGGCTGSTAGSVKIFRYVILGKLVLRELYYLSHPRAIRPITLAGHKVGRDVLGGVTQLFAVYVGVFVLGSFAFLLMDMDLTTALAASAATLGNVGPAFGDIGPLDTYAWMPDLAKLQCALLMLLGRLELFTVLALLTPEFWRK